MKRRVTLEDLKRLNTQYELFSEQKLTLIENDTKDGSDLYQFLLKIENGDKISFRDYPKYVADVDNRFIRFDFDDKLIYELCDSLTHGQIDGFERFRYGNNEYFSHDYSSLEDTIGVNNEDKIAVLGHVVKHEIIDMLNTLGDKISMDYDGTIGFFDEHEPDLLDELDFCIIESRNYHFNEQIVDEINTELKNLLTPFGILDYGSGYEIERYKVTPKILLRLLTKVGNPNMDALELCTHLINISNGTKVENIVREYSDLSIYDFNLDYYSDKIVNRTSDCIKSRLTYYINKYN